MRLADIQREPIEALLERYQLKLVVENADQPIAGSFWGGPEAGIIGSTVYARFDTPIHSLLHETCHIVCMSMARRCTLERDAGGDDVEECAVCYLQIVLADQITSLGRDRLMHDMDAWGYSFRLGNAGDWFRTDAEDARDFLKNHGLLTDNDLPTYRLRG